jgi:hypothetical protein
MNNQVVARFSATLALNHEWRWVIKPWDISKMKNL